MKNKFKGKQYDHKDLMHDSHGPMEHSVLRRHEEGGSGYKHPHDHSQDETKFEQKTDKKTDKKTDQIGE